MGITPPEIDFALLTLGAELNDGVFELDGEGRIAYASERLQALLPGFHPEPEGLPFDGFVHPDDLPALRESFARTLAGHREPSEFRAIDAQGRVHFVRTSSRTLTDAEGRTTGVRGTLIDLTSSWLGSRHVELQRLALEKLVRGESLHGVLSHVCTFVEGLFQDAMCTVMRANDAGRLDLIAGPSLSEEVRRASQNVPPELGYGSCAAALMTRAPAIVEDTLEDPRWAYLGELAGVAGARACWSHPVVVDGATWGTFAITHRRPGKPREVDLRVLSMTATLVSLALEQWTLRTERLTRTHRLDVAGQLTGAFVHDVRNLFSVVDTNLHLLQEDGGQGPDTPIVLAECRAALQRGTRSAEALLGMLRAAPPEVRPGRVDEALDAMLPLLRRTLPQGIRLATSVESGLVARLYPSGLELAVLNLVANARDAMPEGGTISVSARRSGDHVIVAVADEGRGIPAAVRDRVFDPLFTTKTGGEGTGLGLTMVGRFASSVGGSVRLESEEGQGTTVSLRLPAEGERPRVLVVDDDARVRRSLGRLLRAKGFEVEEAEDGVAALAAIRERRPDRVLSDVQMPSLDGVELARRLAEEAPELRVVLMSGAEVNFDALEPGERARFRPQLKPLAEGALLEALR
ncbi:MAG: ATP-binding protein [Myxococcota bacterium]